MLKKPVVLARRRGRRGQLLSAVVCFERLKSVSQVVAPVVSLQERSKRCCVLLSRGVVKERTSAGGRFWVRYVLKAH